MECQQGSIHPWLNSHMVTSFTMICVSKLSELSVGIPCDVLVVVNRLSRMPKVRRISSRECPASVSKWIVP
jgi:hypothetical protein